MKLTEPLGHSQNVNISERDILRHSTQDYETKLQKLKIEFNAIDKNHNGSIDHQELIAFLDSKVRFPLCHSSNPVMYRMMVDSSTGR